MIKGSIKLQELRRRIYAKAKAEKQWRFWGIYVHVCKLETLKISYEMAKKNDGAAGIDGITFGKIEEEGAEKYLEGIRQELITETYKPMRNRKQEIPKGKGKRILSIPTIRDRVVQGALKLILEAIYEADFQNGSFGYRPNKTAHQAIDEVSEAIAKRHIRVIDLDLQAYFDTVRHDILLAKMARRIQDAKVLHLLKMIMKASGKQGVPQGGTISPLLSNIYLNEVDKMLEKAKEVTKEGKYTHISYARFADDIVILVDKYQERWKWLEKAVQKRVGEEFEKIGVEVNEEKTRIVDLSEGEKFDFLGFNFRLIENQKGKTMVLRTPKQEARNALIAKLREVFKRHRAQQLERKTIEKVNSILRGWVNYFRVGNSTKSFKYIREWVERKVRRQLTRTRKKRGFGWKKWSSEQIYSTLGLYKDYEIRYVRKTKAKTDNQVK